MSSSDSSDSSDSDDSSHGGGDTSSGSSGSGSSGSGNTGHHRHHHRSPIHTPRDRSPRLNLVHDDSSSCSDSPRKSHRSRKPRKSSESETTKRAPPRPAPNSYGTINSQKTPRPRTNSELRRANIVCQEVLMAIEHERLLRSTAATARERRRARARTVRNWQYIAMGTFMLLFPIIMFLSLYRSQNRVGTRPWGASPSVGLHESSLDTQNS